MSSKMAWIAPSVALGLGLTLFGSSTASDIDTFPYVWAEACKECHPEIYQAWAKTKHKTALYRLGERQRKGDCVTCHVTGPDQVLYQGEAELNAGVQCEACHGPARAHAAAATENLLPLTEALTLPDEKVCVQCHSKNSPHYQWFDYKTLHKFVHPVDE